MNQFYTVKVRINTPDGYALKVEPRLRTVLIPIGAKSRTEIKGDNQILWFVDCNYKQLFKLQRSVLMFDRMAQNVFNNKVLNKLIKSNVNKPEDYDLLKDLFAHHTSVELVKGD